MHGNNGLREACFIDFDRKKYAKKSLQRCEKGRIILSSSQRNKRDEVASPSVSSKKIFIFDIFTSDVVNKGNEKLPEDVDL